MQAFQTSSRGLAAYLSMGFAKSCKPVSERALIIKPTLIAFPEKEIVIQHCAWEIHKAKKGWELEFSFCCFWRITSSWPRELWDSNSCTFLTYMFCTGNFLGKGFFFHSMSKTSLDHLKSAILCKYRNSTVTEHFQNLVLNMEDKLLARPVTLQSGWQIQAIYLFEAKKLEINVGEKHTKKGKKCA